jgi:hypothetical protein
VWVSVGCQGVAAFSRDKKELREAPTSLPQAVARVAHPSDLGVRIYFDFQLEKM